MKKPKPLPVEPVPGEADWRDHLPAVDSDDLKALNRSDSNSVDHFLVLAFREADKGRAIGLTWPDGWRNGALQPIKRRADHWKENWRLLREQARALRLSSPRPSSREAVRHDPVWAGRPEALARRLWKLPAPPRRMAREQRFDALWFLVQAYRMDTGRRPTLTSRDRQSKPTEKSFDAYLDTFCALANLPIGAMRHLFSNHRRALQTDPFV